VRSWLTAMGTPLLVAVLVAGAFLAVFALRPTPPTIEVRPRDPAPTLVVIVYVHIDGAVFEPGVYPLPSGSRVFEAIDAAGGATDEADVTQINLAARVADGQKLVVPAQGAAGAPPRPSDPSSSSSTAPSSKVIVGDDSARININTASARVLQSLPGVGAITAGRIVQYRQTNGPFTSVNQLRDARLLTAATFEKIKASLSVE